MLIGSPSSREYGQFDLAGHGPQSLWGVQLGWPFGQTQMCLLRNPQAHTKSRDLGLASGQLHMS